MVYLTHVRASDGQSYPIYRDSAGDLYTPLVFRPYEVTVDNTELDRALDLAGGSQLKMET